MSRSVLPVIERAVGPVVRDSLTAARVSAPASSFTSPADLFGPSDTGGFWSMADSDVFTTHDGSTPSAQDDPIGYVGDLSGLGNHLTQDGGNRFTLGTRVGEPAAISDMASSRFDWPFNGVVGTFWFRSQHGAQCFTLDAGATMPAVQFLEAGFIDRDLTFFERSDLLAYLNALAGGVVHDIEALDTEFDMHAYYFNYADAIDFDDTGSPLHFDFETSANSADLPPWTELNDYSSLIPTTAREWGDVVIDTPEDLKVLGLGYNNAATHGPCFDLTRVPGMQSFWWWAGVPEGTLPDPATWPADLRFFYQCGGTGGGGNLVGRFPDFQTAPCKNTLVFFATDSISNELSGEADFHGFPALEFCGIATTKVTKINVNGCSSLTNVGFADYIQFCPMLRDYDFGGTAVGQADLDAALVAMDAQGLSDGEIDARVLGGLVPTGAAVAAVTNLEGRGYTVLVNP